MSFARYDMAVVGDNLAARMTAALLARQGRRVLRLAAPAFRDPWQPSSLFLKKLLDTLGGQSCLGPYQPFQVLARRGRVTVDPALPLADELQREFANAAEPVIGLLAELAETGRQLEEVLWEHGGLPADGVRAAAAWRWLGLRRKLPLAGLSAPLAGRLRDLAEPAGEWLQDLFQGLALQPLAALTVADAALLWAHACRPEGVVETELTALLQKRFEQFHGLDDNLSNLATLEHRDGRWHGALHSGGSFHAEHLILGDLDQELPGRSFPLPHQPLTPPQQLLSSALDGQLSPLLAERVIAGGPLPLRLVMTATANGRCARISASVLADDARIREQLAPLLPFARYTLQVEAYGRNTMRLADPSVAALPLFALPLRLGSHLWCVDEVRLAPQLGSGGAALLAWTLVRRLQPAAGGHHR